MTIITTLFGDLGKGMLARRPYLRLSGVVAAAFALGAAACGAWLEALGAFEGPQDKRLPAYSPFVVSAMLLGPLLLFTFLNITAKRARDIGMPGWLVVGLILLLYPALPQSPHILIAFTVIVWGAFATAPSDVLGRRVRMGS